MTHLDPVCGMTIEEADAVGTHEHDGVTYYFCHPSCLERFKARPEARFSSRPPRPRLRPRRSATFICPMDPEVRSSTPGACPKCGMALEPDLSNPAALTKIEYTCPMHPEIVRDAPGACPICGMALEPRTVTVLDAPNPELVDMTRRFWVAAALGAPVFVVTMADMAGGRPAGRWRTAPLVNWIGLALATPVVFWAGWPFFERAWASLVNRSPNMFTLIALGVGAAYGYSVVGDASRRGSFPPASGCTASSRPTSTPPSSSPCSCCSARCSSCARAAGRARRSGSCSASRRRPRASSRDGDERDVPLGEVHGRRRLPRAARREGAGRRRRRRRAQRRRRVDGHRRADAGREERRATA